MFNQELSERLAVPTYTDTNNNSPSEKSRKGDKYSLRPRSKRNADDDDDDVPTNSKQKKKKAAPLSKYRRKTANARERSRMREINQAFEALRKAVPQLTTTSNPGANEKLTKITTLRLAMKYISTLSAVLSGADSPPEMMSDCSDLDCFLLESDGESVPLQSDLSDHSLTPGDFSVDFVDDTFSPVDFAPLSPDLSEHLTHFDTFLSDFS